MEDDALDLTAPLLLEEGAFDADLSARATLGSSQQLALKPVQPVSLAWRHVSLVIPSKPANNTIRKGSKQQRPGSSTPAANKQQQQQQQPSVAAAPLERCILHGVCGEAPSGQVTAIMGPTGCGKSSLLNALAGRVSFIKGARLTGSISVNGRRVGSPTLAKLCAYVTQEDVLFSFLTVLETLSLASHFYLPSSMAMADKRAYVDAVIKALGLEKARHTIIGSERVRGVSGGERKRVSVGVELISNPSLLFLDEPTSGLDSFQALSVMGAMQGLARSGRTIVAVIHQPRSAIYDTIDNLLLISEGRLIYSGAASGAVSHFSGLGLSCPASFCPSDFFLDVISMDYRTPELEALTRARVQRLANLWQQRQQQQQAEEGEEEAALLLKGGGASSSTSSLLGLLAGQQQHEEESAAASSSSSVEGKFQSSWALQFRVLLVRAFKQSARNSFTLKVKVLSSIVFALIVGLIYSKKKDYHHLKQTDVQNFLGSLFFCTLNQAFASIQQVLQVFPLEKNIVQKERASHAYRLSAYYLSKLCAELPFNLLGPLLFSLIAYWLVGFNPDPWRFLVFVLVILADVVCAVSLGTLVSACARDIPSALAIAPPVMIICMLFSGFFINVKSLPLGAQWCPSGSFIKWAFQAVAQNQLHGLTFYPDPAPPCPAGQQGPCPPPSPVLTGEEVLSSYGLDGLGVWQCVLVVLALGGAFTLGGYLVLLCSSRRYLHMTSSSTQPPPANNGSGSSSSSSSSDGQQQQQAGPLGSSSSSKAGTSNGGSRSRDEQQV